MSDEQPPSPEFEAIREAKQLAWLLDDAVRLPGGFRIGLDALLGLIPVAGDTLGLLASLRIVAIARRAGVPVNVQLRMLANVAGDALIGSIPLVGDLVDFGWKANARNVELLEKALEARGAAAPPAEREL